MKAAPNLLARFLPALLVGVVLVGAGCQSEGNQNLFAPKDSDGVVLFRIEDLARDCGGHDSLLRALLSSRYFRLPNDLLRAATFERTGVAKEGQGLLVHKNLLDGPGSHNVLLVPLLSKADFASSVRRMSGSKTRSSDLFDYVVDGKRLIAWGQERATVYYNPAFEKQSALKHTRRFFKLSEENNLASSDSAFADLKTDFRSLGIWARPENLEIPGHEIPYKELVSMGARLTVDLHWDEQGMASGGSLYTLGNTPHPFAALLKPGLDRQLLEEIPRENPFTAFGFNLDVEAIDQRLQQRPIHEKVELYLSLLETDRQEVLDMLSGNMAFSVLDTNDLQFFLPPSFMGISVRNKKVYNRLMDNLRQLDLVKKESDCYSLKNNEQICTISRKKSILFTNSMPAKQALTQSKDPRLSLNKEGFSEKTTFWMQFRFPLLDYYQDLPKVAGVKKTTLSHYLSTMHLRVDKRNNQCLSYQGRLRYGKRFPDPKGRPYLLQLLDLLRNAPEINA